MLKQTVSSDAGGFTLDDAAGSIRWLSGADWAASAAAVPDARVAMHLGLPPVPAALDDWRGLIHEARHDCVEHAAVWVGVRHRPIERIARGAVELTGGPRLHGPLLAAGLRGCRASGLVAAALCAGPGLDREMRRLWDAGRPDAAMALNAYGSALVEELRSRLFSRLSQICGERGERVLPYLSPGYDGWPLEDQRNLFALLGEAVGPIELLGSGGLRPSKSALVVFGITRDMDVDGAGERFWDLQRRTLKERGEGRPKPGRPGSVRIQHLPTVAGVRSTRPAASGSPRAGGASRHLSAGRRMNDADGESSPRGSLPSRPGSQLA